MRQPRQMLSSLNGCDILSLGYSHAPGPQMNASKRWHQGSLVQFWSGGSCLEAVQASRRVSSRHQLTSMAQKCSRAIQALVMTASACQSPAATLAVAVQHSTICHHPSIVVRLKVIMNGDTGTCLLLASQAGFACVFSASSQMAKHQGPALCYVCPGVCSASSFLQTVQSSLPAWTCIRPFLCCMRGHSLPFYCCLPASCKIL